MNIVFCRPSVSARLFLSLLVITLTVHHCAEVSLAADVEQVSIAEPPLEDADREYWAYQPVERPKVPQIEADRWSRNAIDKFILRKLKSHDLQPVERADHLTLLRRVTFNITGLPPTPAEIIAFENNESKSSYKNVIHELLERRAYGERWAQHWLDLVRFAETDGFEHDHIRPEAWRYRDWVINALNQDLPYDKFLRLQIAGDEIAPESPQALIATGYLLAGPDMPDINSQIERKHNFLNAMTANVCEVVLGLRFGCAQCHHHRTDPISQHDFYRMRAFFEPIDLFKKHSLKIDERAAPVSARITRNRNKDIPESYLWIRGDFTRQGPRIEANYPRVLSSGSDAKNLSSKIYRRTSLANWLTSRKQPLTARVLVNRIWQHHFGVGLISTSSDFGWMGAPASHPELLDWLAAEFMDSDWSIKHIHRLILNSATYQLASYPSKNLSSEQLENWRRLSEQDSNNHYLGRMNRRRLEGESIRDAILAVSGELNTKAGGPGVRPPLPEAVSSTLLKNQWIVTEDPEEHARRSIYLFARRNLRLPLLKSFDKPDQNLSCPNRSQTTIAPQALHLLNSNFVRKQAKSFSKRVRENSKEQAEQIHLAYQLALGRPPSASEQSDAKAFLSLSESNETGWNDLCHALYNLNEFIYMD